MVVTLSPPKFGLAMAPHSTVRRREARTEHAVRDVVSPPWVAHRIERVVPCAAD